MTHPLTKPPSPRSVTQAVSKLTALLARHDSQGRALPPAAFKVEHWERLLQQVRDILTPLQRPATRRVQRRGKPDLTVPSWTLPQDIVNLRLHDYDLLHIAIEFRSPRMVRWLLQRNFPATSYSARRSAMGWAVWTNQPKTVGLLWRAGAPVLVPIRSDRPDHTGPTQVGQTLLHRYLARKVDPDLSPDEAQQHKALARFLVSVYPNPLPVDARGLDPLARAKASPATQEVRQVLAERQAESLDLTLSGSSDPGPRRRQRRF